MAYAPLKMDFVLFISADFNNRLTPLHKIPAKNLKGNLCKKNLALCIESTAHILYNQIRSKLKKILTKLISSTLKTGKIRKGKAAENYFIYFQ